VAFSEERFAWQRGYLPRVKQILAQYFVVEAPFEEDARRNTDLIVLKLDAIRVACRIRKNRYVTEYPDQFTIRVSGSKSELTKILEGWGDYAFYGFAAGDDSNELAAWVLGDLKVFRLWYFRELWSGNRPGIDIPNGDGTQGLAFEINWLPPEFVIARLKATSQLVLEP
jgi:hypothetical protein